MPYKKPNVVLLLLFPLRFTSCASVLNQPLQRISITAGNNIKIVSVRGAIPSGMPAKDTSIAREYYAERSDTPLTVVVQTHTLHKTILLQPKNSAAFWVNIPFNYGLGMLVDRRNPKRYCFPSNNYLSVKDSAIHLSRFAPVKKGTVNFCLSLPFITTFSVNTGGRQYQSFGIFGIEAGAAYYYKANQYVSFNLGAATDRVPVDYFGRGFLRVTSAAYASVRNHHVLGSFDIGYGLSLQRMMLKKIPLADTLLPTQYQPATGVGLSLAAHYRLGSNFGIGVLYQPVLINSATGAQLHYGHFMSFNLAWKFALKR